MNFSKYVKMINVPYGAEFGSHAVKPMYSVSQKIAKRSSYVRIYDILWRGTQDEKLNNAIEFSL